MDSYDVVVIGAGIAGLSAAAVLAEHARVLVCEAEPVAERHSTGRSAAAYIASYGNETVRALTAAGRAWFDNRVEGWAEPPLLAARPTLWIAAAGSGPAADRLAEQITATGTVLERLSPAQTTALCPVVNDAWTQHSRLDPTAFDIDVAAAMAGLRRQYAARGGQTRLAAPVRAITRRGAEWTVTLPGAEVRCAALVNAAGAWADEVAVLAGVTPLGLVPMRRTIAATPVPDGLDPWSWPLVADVEERFYFKPEKAQLLISPADETPSPPCDAKPDDLDVAAAIEQVNAATGLELRSVRRAWAGLRTFAPDRTPVAGADPREPSFVWAAGQGGYGITTSPAIARLVAAAVLGRPAPPDLVATGIDPARLSPARFG